jgi:aspartyl aminopeptidase
LGGGLFFATTADGVASNFLSSIAQDIVERFDSTNTENLREALQSCLLMTDSKCNVPDPLQKEFNAKQLTLGQYLLKQHQ